MPDFYKLDPLAYGTRTITEPSPHEVAQDYARLRDRLTESEQARADDYRTICQQRAEIAALRAEIATLKGETHG